MRERYAPDAVACERGGYRDFGTTCQRRPRFLRSMVHLLLAWLVSAIALVVAAYLLPSVQVANFRSALIAALIIGLLDATLGFLLRLIVFPLTWLLPGLIYLLVNALMILLASRLISGFRVKGYGSALLVAIVVAVVNLLLGY